MGARYAIDAMGWDMLMEEGRRGGREGQLALENEEAHAAVNLVDEPGPGAKHARKTEQRTRKGSNEGMGKAEAEG